MQESSWIGPTSQQTVANEKKPVAFVFDGHNGSGKSTRKSCQDGRHDPSGLTYNLKGQHDGDASGVCLKQN
jgi:hypothetical protein